MASYNIASYPFYSHSSNPDPPRAHTNTAEKRATHNAIERARRESLNIRFQELASALPSLANVRKPSKSVIVSKSIDYVYDTQRRLDVYERRTGRLKKREEDLVKEVNKLREMCGLPADMEVEVDEEEERELAMSVKGGAGAGVGLERGSSMGGKAGSEGSGFGGEGMQPMKEEEGYGEMNMGGPSGFGGAGFSVSPMAEAGMPSSRSEEGDHPHPIMIKHQNTPGSFGHSDDSMSPLMDERMMDDEFGRSYTDDSIYASSFNTPSHLAHPLSSSFHNQPAGVPRRRHTHSHPYAQSLQSTHMRPPPSISAPHLPLDEHGPLPPFHHPSSQIQTPSPTPSPHMHNTNIHGQQYHGHHHPGEGSHAGPIMIPGHGGGNGPHNYPHTPHPSSQGMGMNQGMGGGPSHGGQSHPHPSGRGGGHGGGGGMGMGGHHSHQGHHQQQQQQQQRGGFGYDDSFMGALSGGNGGNGGGEGGEGGQGGNGEGSLGVHHRYEGM
ncbi:hypothetical protein HDV00_000906 [Rhizophlyctis rosea]|nr:hypothetical protein HDV00_000906 [Rhizophlyctis rosea]